MSISREQPASPLGTAQPVKEPEAVRAESLAREAAVQVLQEICHLWAAAAQWALSEQESALALRIPGCSVPSAQDSL